jgi:hypothetical protein
MGTKMDHLDFIVWVCLFPISVATESAIRHKYCDYNYSDAVKYAAGITYIIIWFFVAMNLW